MTLVVGLFSILLALVAFTWVQRHGDPSSAWHATPQALGAEMLP